MKSEEAMEVGWSSAIQRHSSRGYGAMTFESEQVGGANEALYRSLKIDKFNSFLELFIPIRARFVMCELTIISWQFYLHECAVSFLLLLPNLTTTYLGRYSRSTCHPR
jgi:hypothetical protein